MNELVIISGKGGTGKTTVTASFAALAQNAVLADCDVDAADLHLILRPTIRARHEFRSAHTAVVRQTDCIRCGACLLNCRFGAIRRTTDNDTAWAFSADARCNDCDFCVRSCPVKAVDMVKAVQDACGDLGDATFTVDPIFCEGCGVCVDICPMKAIDFPEEVSGEWYMSDTRHGPMVHARLGIAAEHSGKLVHTVRQEARRIAEAERRALIIIDGPPGIGCPAIASITGASLVLIVTEPTMSGQHDLDRVLELTRHFKIPSAVCVNKWDLNPEVTEHIEGAARAAGAHVAPRIRYDRAATKAQLEEKALVEYQTDGCALDVRSLWEDTVRMLDRARLTANPRKEATP